jgi:peroxiredoxin Q/BCP
MPFYPGDFQPVCTKQLCSYRDNVTSFIDFGVQIVGISKNSPEDHASFAEQYGFTFPLLSDPGHKTAKAYGCTSLLMLGGISRAVFIVGRDREVLYRYVEATVFTRRTAGELIEILAELKGAGRI